MIIFTHRFVVFRFTTADSMSFSNIYLMLKKAEESNQVERNGGLVE